MVRFLRDGRSHTGWSDSNRSMFDDTYRADENGLAKSQLRNPSEKEAAGSGLSPETHGEKVELLMP